MQKLKLGVIGAGSYAIKSHLPNFMSWGLNVEFDTVCRLEEKPLAVVAKKFGFRQATLDWHEVVASSPDIVLIGSPAASHYEQVKACLLAGAHVLCEKPFTIDPAEAWDLARIAKNEGRHLVLTYGRNYFPMALAAQRLMTQQDGIGDIEQVTMHMASVHRELLAGSTGHHPTSAPESIPNAETWMNPLLSGGGYGQGQLAHILALTLWLTELQGAEVFSFMSAPMKTSVEYHVAAAVSFTNGAIGMLGGGACHMGSNKNRQQFEIRIIGSTGQLLVDMERDVLWRYKADGESVEFPLEPGAGLYNCNGPVDSFVRLALGQNVANNSPAELGARVVEVLDAAYRSSKSRSPESIRAAEG